VSVASPFSTLGGGATGPDPFGGDTPFGFQIPQGDPSILEQAGSHCSMRALSLTMQGENMRQAIGTAVAGWQGNAQAAFVGYAGHVVGVMSGNSAAFEQAGEALTGFARDLEHAQRVTRQALSDCNTYNGEMQRQQQAAIHYGQTATTLNQQAAIAAHPQTVSELNHQAGIAQDQATTAGRAATTAQGNLRDAEKRGRDADYTYQLQAQAAGRKIQAAAERLRPVQQLPGGAPVPINITPSDIALAQRMLVAGGLPGAASALNDPAELNKLARGGTVNPATVLGLMKAYEQARESQPKPSKGSIMDGIGGFVHTATLGVVGWGNPNTARYRGGSMAAMIPVFDPEGVLVDIDKGAVKLVDDGSSSKNLLETTVDGRPYQVTEGDSVAITSRPTSGRTVYRVYGQPADDGGLVPIDHDAYAKPDGHSWSPSSPARYKDPREGLGLPDANGGRYVVKGKITDPTGITVRHALPIEGTRGGGIEYVVPDPNGQIEIISVGGQNPPF
jgi:hypothetical protein